MAENDTLDKEFVERVLEAYRAADRDKGDDLSKVVAPFFDGIDVELVGELMMVIATYLIGADIQVAWAGIATLANVLPEVRQMFLVDQVRKVRKAMVKPTD